MGLHNSIFGPLDPPPSASKALDQLLTKAWGNAHAADAPTGSEPDFPATFYQDLNQRRWPGRGLLYSVMVHEIFLMSLLVLPTMLHGPAPVEDDREITWIKPNEPLFMPLLPELGGGKNEPAPAAKGKSGPAAGAARRHAAAPAPKASPRVDLVFPGPQTIVSNPPNPDNRIQTILQPDLINPPIIKTPIALPNMVALAAPPVDLPVPPPIPVKVATKPVAPPPPPPAPPAPKPVPKAPEQAPQLQAKVQARELPDAEPIPQPLPPKVPIQVKLALPPPPAPTPPPQPKPVPKAPEQAPQLQAKVQAQQLPDAAPVEQPLAPTPLVKLAARPAPPVPVPATPQPQSKSAAQQPQAPRVVASAKADALATSSLLVLSPIPGPPSEKPNIPVGEAHGQFAISPNVTSAPGTPGGLGPLQSQGSSLSQNRSSASAKGEEQGAPGSDTSSGAAARDSGAPGNGRNSNGGASAQAGKNGAGNGSGGESDSGGGPGKAGAGAGSGAGSQRASADSGGTGTGQGKGSGVGSGSADGPFAGITIADNVNKSAAESAAGADNTHPSRPKAPPARGSYGMSVMAIGSSGGGLPDYGVFKNESVFTVYLPMEQAGKPSASWIFQYALLHNVVPSPSPTPASGVTLTAEGMDTPVEPPYPATKESPAFPPEIAARNPGRMVVVYVVVTAEGKVQDARIVQSPNPLLNPAALESIKKWIFQPAQMNGAPVAIKALVGMVLPTP